MAPSKRTNGHIFVAMVDYRGRLVKGLVPHHWLPWYIRAGAKALYIVRCYPKE